MEDDKNISSEKVDSAAKDSSEINKPKDITKPIEVTPTTKPLAPSKGGETTVAKDPQGMFDYSGCQTYVVKPGDTLYDVAQKFVVALQQLRYFNHVDKYTWKIDAGQTLYIPKEPVFVPVGR